MNKIFRDKPKSLVFDSAEVFWKKNIEYRNILFDDNSGDIILLYDLSNIVMEFSFGVVPLGYDKTQYANTNNLCMVLSNYFVLFNGEQNDSKNTSLLKAESFFEQLLKSYANKVSERPDRRAMIERWANATSVLLWDFFCAHYYSEDKANRCLSNLDLYKRILWAIDRQKEDILYPHERYNKGDNKLGTILYNFWGHDYYKAYFELNKKTESLSQSEKGMFHLNDNKELFRLYYQPFVAQVYSSASSDAEIKAMIMVDSLFQEYTLRLRRLGVYSEDDIRRAVYNWRIVTIDEIKRITLVAKIEMVFASKGFELIEDLREALVLSTVFESIQRIESLCAKCINTINGDVEDYLEKIASGCLTKPWSKKLKDVNIDFDGLYTDMRDKQISSFIRKDAFLDAFYAGDFTLIFKDAQDRAKLYGRKTGYPGCIQILIREVGNMVGDDWKIAAAESIYVGQHTGEAARDAIDKLNETVAARNFAKQVLEARIPDYKFVPRTGVRSK